MTRPVNIDVVAYVDVACPWCDTEQKTVITRLKRWCTLCRCAVGNLSLRKAIATLTAEDPNVNVRIRHVPFFLHPEIPVEGIVKSPSELFGKRIRSAADAVGLTFSTTGFVSNTANALRLLKWTEDVPSVQHDLLTVLFQRYFEKGENVGDMQVLLAAATEVGLPRDAVTKYLESDENARAIGEATRKAREDQGVHGVPYYVFNEGQYRLSGTSIHPIFFFFK